MTKAYTLQLVLCVTGGLAILGDVTVAHTDGFWLSCLGAILVLIATGLFYVTHPRFIGKPIGDKDESTHRKES